MYVQFKFNPKIAWLLSKVVNDDLVRRIRDFVIFKKRPYSDIDLYASAFFSQYRRLITIFPFNVVLSMLMEENKRFYTLDRLFPQQYTFEERFRKRMLVDSILWILRR